MNGEGENEYCKRNAQNKTVRNVLAAIRVRSNSITTAAEWPASIATAFHASVRGKAQAQAQCTLQLLCAARVGLTRCAFLSVGDQVGDLRNGIHHPSGFPRSKFAVVVHPEGPD